MNSFELKQKAESQIPSDLAKKLGFKETLNLARQMLINKNWDESLQKYATNVLEEIKKQHSEKWNSNWEYDAFLGYAYDILLKYDERYASYKSASNKVFPLPPQLLVALASCCWAPGKPPVTEEEAILLVKQAISSVKYIEAVELLRGLYKSTGNVEEQRYWEKVLNEIKEIGPHLPLLDHLSDI